MKRLAIILSLLLAGETAAAPPMPVQLAAQQRSRIVLDLDFTRMTVLDPRITFNRNGPEVDWDCTQQPPVLKTFPNDVPALGVCDPKTGVNPGLGLWATSLIQNRWSNDLTQSYWIKTNATAALTTGPDGIANSASRITSTADNATVCTSPMSSVFRAVSAFMRHPSGVGPVAISADNGVTWTDVTTSISSTEWTRVPKNSAIYGAPAVGGICFRMSKTGNAIDVAYANAEFDPNKHLVSPTTPILTQAAANISQAPDLAWLDLSKITGFDPTNFTIVAKVMTPVFIVPGGFNASLRRSALQLDDGAGVNATYLNYQNDAYTPTGVCNPSFSPTTVPNCPAMNYAQNTGNFVASTGKVRCSVYPPDQLSGVQPPIAGAFATIAFSVVLGSWDAIVCNNGAPSLIMGNGRLNPGGATLPVMFRGGITPVFTQRLSRLVFGSAPWDIFNLGGTMTPGDTIAPVITWYDPPGTQHQVSATPYTVLGGDTVTSVRAALANAINTTPAMQAIGVSAQVMDSTYGTGVVTPHPMAIFPTWSGIVTGAQTESISQYSGNTGSWYGYVQSVRIYSPALGSEELRAALPNTTPPVMAPTFLALQRGGHPLFNTAEIIPCNRC